MNQHRGTWMPLLIVMLAASACQSAQPTSNASPRTHPSVTAASADPQRCARLAQRGFTPCPPTPDRLQLPPTTIRNATNGAIPDATAQQWGHAFQLTEAYYRWAMQANARSALTGAGFADPSTQAVDDLFGSDLMDLDNAKRANGVLVYDPPTIRIAQIVVVPTSLGDAMGRQGLKPASYAIAVRFAGPTRRSIRAADGSQTVVSSRDGTYVVDALIWGELRPDADLGSIWFEYGIYGCQGQVKDACQL
jgi:hypothetical protein